MKKLKEIGKVFLKVLAIWCFFSLLASFVQLMEVNSGRASCETKAYIEYVFFADLFCEVK